MRTLQTLVTRVRDEWRARWTWYQAQRQVPRARRWFDAYNT